MAEVDVNVPNVSDLLRATPITLKMLLAVLFTCCGGFGGGAVAWYVVTADVAAIKVDREKVKAARDEALAKLGAADAAAAAALAALGRSQERLADRMDTADRRQAETLSNWTPWREGVNAEIKAAQAQSFEQAALKQKTEQLDDRADRIVALFERRLSELGDKLTAVQLDVAVIKSRGEDSKRAQPPFLENPIWTGPLSPIVRRAAGRTGEGRETYLAKRPKSSVLRLLTH